MSNILVRGIGAVSPAGWTAGHLRDAVEQGIPLSASEIAYPGSSKPLNVRRVPTPAARPAFVTHNRMRRTSPIGHYAVAAALEALSGMPENKDGLGIIYCAMAGCVNFSRRFYDETLKDPATASPLIFPETVFNAPASHLGALLGCDSINYTLVGDPGTYLQGLALAADWLTCGKVAGCLVIGAEELDWLVAQAFGLFDPQGVVSEGAGALYLRKGSPKPGDIELQAITSSHLFWNKADRKRAAHRARAEIGPRGSGCLLCDSTQSIPRLDRDETAAWSDWTGTRLSPKRICGEAFMAAAAWQCVATVDAVARGVFKEGIVNVVGCNQQAIAARFARVETGL